MIHDDCVDSRSLSGPSAGPAGVARAEVPFPARPAAAGVLKALRALAEEEKLRRYLCVCLEPRRRRAGLVDVLPYAEFLEALWNGEFS